MIPENEKLPMASGRLEALGDGIFSVAMTVLVIELKLPTVEGNSVRGLLHGLYETRQELFCYFISFIVLGIMWFGHRMVFEYISWTIRYFIFPWRFILYSCVSCSIQYKISCS
jgi:uncharacterized membrane protein